MRFQNNNTVRKTCVIVGVCMLLVATIVLVFWQWEIHSSEKQSKNYVDTLRMLLPEIQASVPEERNNNTMSIISLDGTDFVGILELPRFDSELPVCADWGKTSKYPCRFGGSIYDRTMQIGATSQKGQYDFYREISTGDSVIYTDVEGNRFTYLVTDIRYVKNIDESNLKREESSLVLFVKNNYAFEYIIIFCDILS